MFVNQNSGFRVANSVFGTVISGFGIEESAIRNRNSDVMVEKSGFKIENSGFGITKSRLEDLKAEFEAELRVELKAELQAENQAKLPTASTEGRGPFSSTARTLPSQYEVISFTLVSHASREPFLVQRQAVLGPCMVICMCQTDFLGRTSAGQYHV